MPSFRLDRFLSRYLFHPFLRLSRAASDQRVPILMYHSISDDPESASHPYYHINTAPAVFADQMRFLSENGYTVVDLKTLKNLFGTNEKITKKNAVITFDDGYGDFHSNAFPVLQKYHFPATVFLPTAFIGNQQNKLRGKRHLTWSQVSELSNRGIRFGSHTITHPELSRLNNEVVEYEISESKKTIEGMIGKEIDTFSYPFRFPDGNNQFIEDLRRLLQQHGYQCGVSTRIGTTSMDDDRYFSRRVPINSEDDIAFFQAKLEGGYNWLYPLQRFRKFMGPRA